MKKILFLLLLSISAFGQVSTGQETEFDYGIKNNASQPVTSPVFVVTESTTGVYGKASVNNLPVSIPAQTALNLKVNNSSLGIDSGVATLDGSGKVPLTQINDVLLGSVNYKGTYNAITNTPALPTPATGNKGFYYIVSTAGVQVGLTLNSGDWVISNGVAWGKVDNNNAVTSVNGLVGSVVLTTANVSDSTNKRYQTDSQQINNDATSSIQNQINSKISGTGTPNYIPKFTSGSTLGSSQIYDDSAIVAIGYGGSNPAKFNVYDQTSLGTTIGNYRTVFSSGLSVPNTMYANQFFVRYSSSTDWESVGILDGIQVDVSFTTPSTAMAFWERHPAANKQFFGSLGVRDLTIDSAVHGVGIGIETPTNYGVGTSALSINGSAGSGFFDVYNTGVRKGCLYSSPTSFNMSTTTGDLVFETGGVEKARIAYNGNLLVGISTDNGSKLQVNGTISASPATLSNQVVVKSQLDLKADIATDANNVKLTGDQTIAGVKTFQNGLYTNSNISLGLNATIFKESAIGANPPYTSFSVNAAGKLFSTSLMLSGLNASEILGTDASKNLVSLPIATYPSLTELSYVKGVTSGVQGQINAVSASILEQNNIFTTSSYTLQLSDANNRVTSNYTGNLNIPITIPLNSSVAFPIGTKIKISEIGTNTFGYTISAPWVTLRTNNGLASSYLVADNGIITLTKSNTNEWFIENSSPFYLDGVKMVFNGNLSAGYVYANKLVSDFVGIDNQTNITFGQTTSFNKFANYTGISGIETGIQTPLSFLPTSGTGIFNNLTLNPTINQTGGANGITRGLYINPTLTSAADFRAIEVTAGKVIIPNGNAVNEAVNAGQVAKQLKDFYADVNNSLITETDLLTYTTTANRLNATGEKIIASYGGTFNDGTASSQLKIYFAGTVIGDTGALTMSVSGAFIVNVSIMRTGATTARAMVNISTPGASTASYTKYTSLTGLTFTGTNIIKLTGTAGGATGGDNDITASYGNVIWQPAAL